MFWIKIQDNQVIGVKELYTSPKKPTLTFTSSYAKIHQKTPSEFVRQYHTINPQHFFKPFRDICYSI